MSNSLAALEGMAYPGRVILIGLDRASKSVAVAYAVTGRSPSSQARKLRFDGQSIWTEPTQREILCQGKEELLIYRAMAISATIVVSNGQQTEDILKAISLAKEPVEVLKIGLERWSFETDAPHFTPRMAGCVLPDGKACLAIIRKRGQASEERSFYPWVLEPGQGKMLATYSGREDNPLPSFDRDPLDIDIISPKAASLAEDLFNSLAPAPSAPDYRVAVACVYASTRNFLDFDVHIINKKER